MLYFYDKKGTKIGPIHIESLKKFAETKKINPDTIITNEKGKQWKAREMPELKFNEFEFFIVKTLRNLAYKPKKYIDDKTYIEKHAHLKNETPIKNNKPIKNKRSIKNNIPIEYNTHLKIRHKIDWKKITLNILIFTTFILVNLLIIVIILGQIKNLIK